MNDRMERKIIRALHKLRSEEVAFTAGRILEETNLAAEGINTRDVCRCLQQRCCDVSQLQVDYQWC